MSVRMGILLAAVVFAAAVVLLIVLSQALTIYRQTEATWTIQGTCANSGDGLPIQGAMVKGAFMQPVKFSHHLFRTTPEKILFTVMTDRDGRFELSGKGGAVFVVATAQGFEEAVWNSTARNGSIHIESNVVLRLDRSTGP